MYYFESINVIIVNMNCYELLILVSEMVYLIVDFNFKWRRSLTYAGYLERKLR
jgi:hypothetical protein